MIKTILGSMKPKTQAGKNVPLFNDNSSTSESLMLPRISHGPWILLSFSTATRLTDKNFEKNCKLNSAAPKWNAVVLSKVA